MFSYGRVYGGLDPRHMPAVYPHQSPLLSRLMPIYLKLFGYPDVAGHVRMPLVLRYLQPRRGQVILDAGCGRGIYLNTLAVRYGASGVGVDMKEELLEQARELAAALGSRATFEKMDLTDLRLADESFDRIICVEVLEHVREDELAVKELARVLKPDGVLVITVPHRKPAISAEELAAYEQAAPLEHVRDGYTIDELAALCRGAGLTITRHTSYWRRMGDFAIVSQQYLYRRNLAALNALSHPLLVLLAKLDALLPASRKDKGIVVRVTRR